MKKSMKTALACIVAALIPAALTATEEGYRDPAFGTGMHFQYNPGKADQEQVI